MHDGKREETKAEEMTWTSAASQPPFILGKRIKDGTKKKHRKEPRTNMGMKGNNASRYHNRAVILLPRNSASWSNRATFDAQAEWYFDLGTWKASAISLARTFPYLSITLLSENLVYICDLCNAQPSDLMGWP